MKILGYFSLVLILLPIVGWAQVLHQELQETVTGEVIEVLDERERDITGTNATAIVQKVAVLITGGEAAERSIKLEQDLVVLKAGDKIIINRLVAVDGVEYFEFKDFDRRGLLATLGVVFALLLVGFSGWQGVRALASLGLSIAAILFVLVPALLNGIDPVLASTGIAAVILAAVLFGTHGFHIRIWIAFAGTFSAVVFTALIAAWWVRAAHLTGLGTDAAVYLNFSTGGTLDFGGLLLGSIIIGILGVLDDVSITQASVVHELKHANAALKPHELYRRAITVGRDHIGSLVNTLALAYVGASLPLVLLLARASSDIGLTLNQEIVAAEIARIVVGSIGLILAVPFTTLVAAWWFGTHGVDERDDTLHHHHHHH